MRRGERRDAEFRELALQQIQESSVSQVARELGVSVRTLYRWRHRCREKKARAPVPLKHRQAAEIQKLKQALAERVLEVDFFKGALQKVEARRQNKDGSGARAFTTKSGE